MDKNQRGEVRYRMVSGFAQLIIILTGALVVLMTIGFFAFKNGQLKLNSLNNKSALSPTPTANLSREESKDWKIYTNTEYRFSFNYPNNYVYKEIPPSGLDKAIVVDLRKADNELILLIKANKEYLPGSVTSYLDTESSGIKEINGIVWKEYKLPQSYQDGGIKTSPIYALQVENNKILYSITFYNQQELNELQTQILSTFKFKE